MEKYTAHYSLTELQALIQVLGRQAFTGIALKGGQAMGLNIANMLTIIARLTQKDLYKSMTTYDNHKVWQDVYHAKVTVKDQTKIAYIKLTLRDGKPVVQFKEK